MGLAFKKVSSFFHLFWQDLHMTQSKLDTLAYLLDYSVMALLCGDNKHS